MEKLKRIRIGEKRYPYKIDLNVLEQIQEEYGSINKFERDILGYVFEKDREGNQIYTKEGKPLMRRTEPSVRAIKAVLPAAINEGLAIEADETGKEFEPVTEEQIFRECKIAYETLADMMHEEFTRCFVIKKR